MSRLAYAGVATLLTVAAACGHDVGGDINQGVAYGRGALASGQELLDTAKGIGTTSLAVFNRGIDCVQDPSGCVTEEEAEVAGKFVLNQVCGTDKVDKECAKAVAIATFTAITTATTDKDYSYSVAFNGQLCTVTITGRPIDLLNPTAARARKVCNPAPTPATTAS